MSKPSWKDAPGWANWLAMDEDGTWFWYEAEPGMVKMPDRNGWHSNGGRWDIAQAWHYKWNKTLEQRP